MFETPLSSDRLDQARRYVADFFQKRQNPRLVWRQESLSVRLEALTAALAQAEGCPPAEAEQARLAALFYPLGYSLDYQNPMAATQRELLAFGAPQAAEVITDVQAPTTQAAALLADALAIASWLDEDAPDLQLLEKDLVQGYASDRMEWAQWRMQLLLNLRFATPAARRQYQVLLAQRIKEQRNRLEKWTKNLLLPEGAPAVSATETEPEFGGLEELPPQRLAQTYFRTVFRNHIHLSAIADNKAHIMISVNAILISVLISFVSYRNLAETKPMVLLPVVIFLVTGLASLICAVLSARPRVNNLNPSASADPEQLRRNLAFFGNFVALPEEQFTALLAQNLRDGSSLYGNLARDLYHLGRVLDLKYKYLSVAYNVFMVGLVATVGSFLLALWW